MCESIFFPFFPLFLQRTLDRVLQRIGFLFVHMYVRVRACARARERVCVCVFVCDNNESDLL